MAAKRSSGPSMTLFPFLSVLAAVMGTLILIIAGMSQLALANPKEKIVVHAYDETVKNPIFVECTEDGLTVFPDDPRSGPGVHVPRDEIESADNRFAEAISRATLDPTRYIQLLVRPDGVRSFQLARHAIGREPIDYGYEPLVSDQPVRFEVLPDAQPSQEGP